VADVTQIVGELLQLGVVVADGEVALHNVTELGLEKNGVLHLIVAEETLNVRPDGERGGVGLVDEVEDILGDRGVDLIGEATIDLTPFGITLVDGRRRAGVANEAELVKNIVKVATPLTVVGIKEVELNGNVIVDVDRLNHGEGSK
jgi:hypothetical protein